MGCNRVAGHAHEGILLNSTIRLAAHHSKQAARLLLAGTWLNSKACIRQLSSMNSVCSRVHVSHCKLLLAWETPLSRLIQVPQVPRHIQSAHKRKDKKQATKTHCSPALLLSLLLARTRHRPTRHMVRSRPEADKYCPLNLHDRFMRQSKCTMLCNQHSPPTPRICFETTWLKCLDAAT